MADETIPTLYPASAPPRRGNRRWLWIALGLLVAFIVSTGMGVVSGRILVAEGYLPATQEYGYGYSQRRFVKENMFGMRSEERIGLILWKSRQRPLVDQLFQDLGGHQIWPVPKTGRVYALQPDYSLKEIPLSTWEARRAMEKIWEADRTGVLQRDAFWNDRIEPELQLVGPESPATAPAEEAVSP